jgi:hypothetical protein
MRVSLRSRRWSNAENLTKKRRIPWPVVWFIEMSRAPSSSFVPNFFQFISLQFSLRLDFDIIQMKRLSFFGAAVICLASSGERDGAQLLWMHRPADQMVAVKSKGKISESERRLNNKLSVLTQIPFRI